MKLIEHLEHVLGLVERSAPYSEIKGALLGMHEELAGAQRAADQNLKLLEENAKLRAEQARRKSPDLEALSKDMLKFFFDQGEGISGYAIQQHFGLEISAADYHIDALLRRKFITQTRLGSDSASCWFQITGEGREFMMKNMA